MARLNDFMVRADLTPFMEYCKEFGRLVRYAKGESFVEECAVCRNVALIRSGYSSQQHTDNQNSCINIEVANQNRQGNWAQIS